MLTKKIINLSTCASPARDVIRLRKAGWLLSLFSSALFIPFPTNAQADPPRRVSESSPNRYWEESTSLEPRVTGDDRTLPTASRQPTDTTVPTASRQPTDTVLPTASRRPTDTVLSTSSKDDGGPEEAVGHPTNPFGCAADSLAFAVGTVPDSSRVFNRLNSRLNDLEHGLRSELQKEFDATEREMSQPTSRAAHSETQKSTTNP